MGKEFRNLSLLAFVVCLLAIVIWLPHILLLPNFWGLNFQNGFSTIYKNFDGLEYVVIAKSLYNPEIIASLPYTLAPGYYASHFPGYSILILLFAPLLGFLKSMLFAAILSTILATWTFYFLVKDFKLSQSPFFLSLLFLILPARWLIVHSVGSSEPLFIFLTLAAIYFFLKYEQGQFIYLILSAMFGLLAQITRPPGILLFIALTLYICFKMQSSARKDGLKKAIGKHLSYFPFIIIPLGLLGLFYYFGLTYNNFWAYFHSGDNIHLTFPPFQVFNKYQYWVGDIWLEDIVYIFILGFLGAATLFKQRLYPLSFFILTYLIASTFIAHRDISRYILPTAPFIIIAFEKVLTSREFKIILPIIIIITYLYTQNFIIHNIAPIPDLAPYN